MREASELGFSSEEIGKALNRNPSTVRGLLQSLREKTQ